MAEVVDNEINEENISNEIEDDAASIDNTVTENNTQENDSINESEAETELKSVFELSDEEFAKLDFPSDDVKEEGEENKSLSNSDESTKLKDEKSEIETKEPEQDNKIDSKEIDSEETNSEIDENKTESSSDKSEQKIDYIESYKTALAPLKANGKMHNINSIEDLRAFASMGMNYHDKMSKIKPFRVQSKKLENNNITDEKLDFLIDLNNGNPDAIKKLITDNKIDPLDLNLEENNDYSPTKHDVSDAELQLDSVLEDINKTETYSTTMNIVSKKWDDSSQSAILAEPIIIKHLNDQVASGVYDQITTKVDYMRMKGELSGVSDIEAYRIVGDEIQANGGFSTKNNSSNTELPSKANAISDFKSNSKSIPKQPTKQSRTNIANRKKAASPTKSMPTKSDTGIAPNPFELSEDDFKKQYERLMR